MYNKIQLKQKLSKLATIFGKCSETHHKHITITSSYFLFLNFIWTYLDEGFPSSDEFSEVFYTFPEDRKIILLRLWHNLRIKHLILTKSTDPSQHELFAVIIAPTPHVVSSIVTLKCNPKTGEIVWHTLFLSSHDDGVTKNLSNYPPKSFRSCCDHNYENTVLILFKAKFATLMEKYSIFLNPCYQLLFAKIKKIALYHWSRDISRESC